MRRTAVPILAAALFALVGCGGDDDVADGPVLTIEAIQEPSSRGPEAALVRRAFAALDDAGLDVSGRRDRIDVCEQLLCVARTTSKAVTITAWPDADTAARVADRSVGTLGVTFASGAVPRDEQGAYVRAIRRALRR